MRTIGTLDSQLAAARFSDALFVKGIENQIEPEDDGRFSVWVLDDDQLGAASELLTSFRANPSDPAFDRSTALAREQRSRLQRIDGQSRSTVADSARVGYERSFNAFGIVPIVLILICVAVAIASNLGENPKPIRSLFISEYYFDRGTNTSIHLNALAADEDGAAQPNIARAMRTGFLPEVRDGQIWRLITPIFIHFGILHLVFNAMMLRDLGNFIESRFGAGYLLALVLVIALASNFPQALWGSPNFGGMSGVDYGLFGFLWMRGKFDRSQGWQVNKNTVSMLLMWFFLCLFGIIPHVANTVHAVGLGVGMAWGWISARK